MPKVVAKKIILLQCKLFQGNNLDARRVMRTMKCSIIDLEKDLMIQGVGNILKKNLKSNILKKNLSPLFKYRWRHGGTLMNMRCFWKQFLF